MQKLGLEVILLSGDRQEVVTAIANSLGISQFYAQVAPTEKSALIADLQTKEGKIVAMVGDGINDTPALAAADVSFAVGNIDVTLETADVVLTSGDLRRLAYAIKLSQRTLSVIKQSIVLALVLNGTFILLGTLGIIGLPVAVLEDMGSSLFVTLNAMRLFNTPIGEA